MTRLSPDEMSIVMRGLAVQPLVAGAVAFLVAPFPVSVVLGGFFAIAGALITLVAYPVLLTLIRRRQLTRERTLVSGALLGNIPAALVGLFLIVGRSSTAGDFLNLLYPTAVGTLAGVAGAAVFWVMSGRYLKFDGSRV